MGRSKWQGRVADSSPPSNANVKKSGAISIPPYIIMVLCLTNLAQGETFTFINNETDRIHESSELAYALKLHSLDTIDFSGMPKTAI